MYPERISLFSRKALDWLGHVEPTSLKEASQTARALCIWGHDANIPINRIKQAQSADHWESDNPVRDTARACTALEECGIPCKDSALWLLSVQYDNGSWNDDVYDTCYALMALGTMHQQNQQGVQWLVDYLSDDRMHPGTIALINSALIYQDPGGQSDLIERNSSWLLARWSNDQLEHIATTCLVIQSLILAGKSGNIGQHLEQVLDRLEDREWRVSIVALVLITLKMYYTHNTGE